MRPSWLCAVGLLALMAVPAARGEEPVREALTNESVVRLFAGGASPEEIAALLETSTVDFDLSDEMVAELAIAGLPAELIAAMRRRQAEQAPAAEPSTAASVASARLAIELVGSKEGEAPVLRVAGKLDFVLRERWQLDRALEQRPFEDVAVFLACRSATHVGDHWRSSTPLGGDFTASRHRMHAFISGAQRSGGEVLELVLPEPIEVELDPAEPHDLSLGIALAVDGQYYVFSESRLDGVELEAGLNHREAVLRSGRSGALERLSLAFSTSPSGAR